MAADPAQIAAGAVQRPGQRPPRHGAADDGKVQRFGRRAEQALDEGRRLGRRLRRHRQAIGREALLRQRLDSALRPRNVLEHAHREQRRFDLSHSVAPDPGSKYRTF
jgi:hypothetical protein